MRKSNMVSIKSERNLQEDLIKDYYKSLYGDKQDTFRLRKKAKSEKLSKLKKKFTKSNTKKLSRKNKK